MGTSDEDIQKLKESERIFPELYDRESPSHQVTVSPFFLQTTPVTRRQFRLFDPHHESTHVDSSWGFSDVFRKYAPEDECPMINVCWWDAWAFSRWMGGRLPSEAEWEYACRAGTITEYSFGDDPAELGDYGWFEGNSGRQTQPVGAKKPNPWGLCDMHGNVWEWCEDAWHDNYEGAPDDGSTWGSDAAAGSSRVYRGGGWALHARYCRCACRAGGPPGTRGGALGFRFVLAARFNEDVRAFP